MTVTKAELADGLVTESVLQKRDAKDLVDALFEEMRLQLEDGNLIKVSGFGNFELRNKNERPGRNPKTGEDIPILARRVVTFKAGQKLRARVEQLNGLSAEEEEEG